MVSDVVQTPKKTDTLSVWLNYLGNIHSTAIDMGLERVLPVFEHLKINKNAFVFMVAGTNGKGSTTATIAQICQTAGLKTALYQSPHLVSFTERIRIDGVEVSDELLIDAFIQIEQARVACQLSLSFFEITTLAALLIFSQANCDVWVLEVGLGGRLDVVNVIDPDVCVITNVAIDHTDWLGDTREKIGSEKAGILRHNTTLVYGESDMPSSVRQKIDELSVACHQYGQTFAYEDGSEQWIYSGVGATLVLPKPSLALVNASIAITAVLASPFINELDGDSIATALRGVKLAGRFDRRCIVGREWLFDVAHNEAGIEFLLSQFTVLWRQFAQKTPKARLFVLFSMLADKDIDAVLRLISKQKLPITSWHIAMLDNPRAIAVDKLSQKITSYLPNDRIVEYQSIAQATKGVIDDSEQGDFVLCFGSFHTIGESLVALGQYRDFKPI